MKALRFLFLAAVAATLSACATVETTTRAAPGNLPLNAGQPSVITPSFRVEALTVRVPASLTVSERNGYYPNADIVWRGDMLGNRHEQIAALMQEALDDGVAALDGEMPVIVDITVRRFHGLTERARYTVGGMHTIRFDMVLRNAMTGSEILTREGVRADLAGLGGMMALAAEARGETQKLRIQAHLKQVIQMELRKPIPTEALSPQIGQLVPGTPEAAPL